MSLAMCSRSHDKCEKYNECLRGTGSSGIEEPLTLNWIVDFYKTKKEGKDCEYFIQGIKIHK